MFSLNIKHPTTCWRSHAKPACYTVQLKRCEDKLFFLCQNCISFFFEKIKVHNRLIDVEDEYINIKIRIALTL